MKLLVTGGAGFIGSAFVRYCMSQPGARYQIVNLDKLTYAGNLDNLTEIEGKTGYTFVHGDICDAALVKTISEICRAQKISCKKMISRAYHDSLFMAQICPTTIIFIPCFKGYSHRPDEFSSPEQIEKGVHVLAETLAACSSAAVQ